MKDDRVILTAIGVALDVDIEDTEAALRRIGDVLGKQDAAGTGAEDGLGADEGIEDRVKTGALEVLEKGRGLAAREDEGVDLPFAFRRGDLVRLADEAGRGAELPQTPSVDVKGALKGENADPWSIDHPLRVAARSSQPDWITQRYVANRGFWCVSFRAGEKPRMVTLFAAAAFVISVLFAMGEVAYKRSFPKVMGAFVALFLVLLVGSAFLH